MGPTLTIATANAYSWNTALSLKVVNNTNVAWQIMPGPNQEGFWIQPNTSAYAPTTGNTWVLISWGGNFGNTTGNGNFDDPVQLGTMSAQTAAYGGGINIGETWGFTAIGDNDNLVLDGNSSDGKKINLTVTRVRGVAVTRGNDDDPKVLGDVFCLDTGVVGFVNQNDSVRCPANETRIVLANHTYIDDPTQYDPDYLIDNVYFTCSCSAGCTPSYYPTIPGYYVYGIDLVPHSVQNPTNAIFLNIPGPV